MRFRIFVGGFLAVLVFVCLMGFAPETTRADSLRDQMIAQAKKEGQFVLAGSNADKMRDDLAGFKKLYPFITIKAFVGNTADTINRATAEAQAGKVSIDLPATSSDGLALLAKLNLLQKMEYHHLKDIPADTQPKKGLYQQLFMNPRTQGVYNTDLVRPDEIPKSWDEVADIKWKGKTMIARSAEEIPAHLAFLWGEGENLNWERSFAFFRKLEEQKPIIARGFRGGIKRVAAGEVPIFWLAAVGPAGRMADVGAPIGLIAFPKFTGSFRSFGILKGSRHTAAAWLFIDYLTSPQGQKEYTDFISAKVPLNKKAEVGKLAKWLIKQNATVENTKPLDAEIVFDPQVTKKSENFFLKLLGIK